MDFLLRQMVAYCPIKSCHTSPMPKRVLAILTTVVVGSLVLSLPAQALTDIAPSSVGLPVVHSGEVAKYKRIVAIADGSAEIVAALGYRSDLVGRDIASTLPELATIPIDTDAHQINVERVLSQRPDLILIDSNSSPQSAIDAIKKAGIHVALIPAPFTVAGVLVKEKAIADLLKTPKAFQLLASKITKKTFTPSKTKTLFLYLRGTASIYLIAGKGSGADSLFSTIGVHDVGSASLAQPFSAMTSEKLIALSPDVIVLMTKGLASVGGLSGFLKLPGVAQTPAGIHKRIVTVDDSLLLSFGARTPTLLSLLRTAIDKEMAHS
jgi:iron complex transport system substrate-binding protein